MTEFKHYGSEFSKTAAIERDMSRVFSILVKEFDEVEGEWTVEEDYNPDTYEQFFVLISPSGKRIHIENDVSPVERHLYAKLLAMALTIVFHSFRYIEVERESRFTLEKKLRRLKGAVKRAYLRGLMDAGEAISQLNPTSPTSRDILDEALSTIKQMFVEKNESGKRKSFEDAGLDPSTGKIRTDD